MNYKSIWQIIIIDKNKSWVVFEHNTCVILMDPEQDLAQQAKKLLKEYGPYFVGTASADMEVVQMKNYPGCVVLGHHPDILNYVPPEDFESDYENTASIGILGRHNRSLDAESLHIMHVEDNRNN